MKVLGNILKCSPGGLWKDDYALICSYSSTKAIIDLGTMTLLFPLLESLVLLSGPVFVRIK